jgi:tetratricopeptide (TPR) repeat protein
MILMSDRAQINRPNKTGLSLPTPLVLGVMLLLASCAPRVTQVTTSGLNPVEIIERSPRIYHVRFEGLADSIETARAAKYLVGGVESRFEIDPADTGRFEDDPGKKLALLEYVKAGRRFEAGAGQASLRHIRRSLEADPSFRPSYVLLGNLLLAQGRFEEAVDLFSKVVSWDMTDSEALVGLARCYMFTGKLEAARQTLVDAVIFDRVNIGAWRGLFALGEVQEFNIVDHDILELGHVREAGGRHYDIVIDAGLEDCPSQASAWIVFASQRAVWRYEGKFKESLGVTGYRPTYQEDVDCYMALAAAWKILAAEDSASCESDELDHMVEVAEDGFLVPHVLFDFICVEDPTAARDFTAEIIEEIRSYVNTYVLVPRG